MPSPAVLTMAGHAHGALMDQVYRRQRHIYDLTRKYYLFGRDRLIDELALRPNETLVEVGCGTARNLIRIARRYPGAALYGLDASGEMLKTAAYNISRAGLSGRIRLVEGFAEALTPALFGLDRAFDRVLFPYSLSMIPDWRQALAAAGEALAPDGQVHAVDFADLSGLGGVGAALLRAWLRLFHVTPRIEIIQALERDDAPAADRGHLVLLPARYAFLWSGNKKAVKDLAGIHVAGLSQPRRKSR